jgi:hypothetical protein
LHVGTNDIDNRVDSDDILDRIIGLTSAVKAQGSDIKIIISGILPRPKDFLVTQKVITEVNQKIQKWAATRGFVHFHPTFRTFMHEGKPKTEVGLFARDGLHIAGKGIRRMNNILINLIRLWRAGRLF